MRLLCLRTIQGHKRDKNTSNKQDQNIPIAYNCLWQKNILDKSSQDGLSIFFPLGCTAQHGFHYKFSILNNEINVNTSLCDEGFHIAYFFVCKPQLIAVYKFYSLQADNSIVN